LGIISKTVLIKWNSSNRKHFEKKGYTFTKWKDEFEVKVEDLMNGSKVKVEIECDRCNKKLKIIRYDKYKKYVKEDGKYYCQPCSNKLFGYENKRKTKLKNSKSFEQWCVENNHQDLLDKWDYELNDCKPSEILYGTANKYHFKCSEGLHESELKSISSYTNEKSNMLCNQCNSFAQWGIDNIGEDFLDKYWDWEKNSISPWKTSRGTDKKVYIKCQEKDYHGSYKTSCNTFTSRESRCPYCNSKEIHLLDSLGTLYPEVLDIWSDNNKNSPYEYAPMSMKIAYFKCLENKHPNYKRKIATSTLCNFKCPECVRERDESFLQEKVRLYLESLNYNVLHEHNCTIIPKNPKTKMNLPYDNEVVELKLIIEIHGMQHYELSGFHQTAAKHNNTTLEEELNYQKLKDRYKRMYAKHQGYFYLEIPCWNDDKEEIWKKLIDNKINEILNIYE
jgi:hypothetical protein